MPVAISVAVRGTMAAGKAVTLSDNSNGGNQGVVAMKVMAAAVAGCLFICLSCSYYKINIAFITIIKENSLRQTFIWWWRFKEGGVSNGGG